MKLDTDILLYCLANTFNTILFVDLCDDAAHYVKHNKKMFSKLDINNKVYYTEYALTLATQLSQYISQIKKFELNLDSDNEIIHDFRLISGKRTHYISMSHNTIKLNNIIPKKIMKICNYKKNTNMYKNYMYGYNKINDDAYKKIQKSTHYSNLTSKQKDNYIFNPVCKLVVDTLSKKKKCAQNLYDYLFSDNKRIVLKLYKNKFAVYDFNLGDNNVESLKMNIASTNEISIIFNNKSEFLLSLHTNNSDIKNQLSLKFKTQFKNMDDIFLVSSTKI